MNIDALPLDVLVWLPLGPWALLGLLCLYQWKRNRADDAHARVATRDVITQSMQHSEANDDVHGEQDDSGAEEPADDEPEGSGVHAHRLPIYLPPGIPSVSERLDRWTELS